jgi:hypothetical protein
MACELESHIQWGPTETSSMSEDERLKRITCCCFKMEHCRTRQKEPKYADCATLYKSWELDWLHELHILLYTPELSNFYLPDNIFYDL